MSTAINQIYSVCIRRRDIYLFLPKSADHMKPLRRAVCVAIGIEILYGIH